MAMSMADLLAQNTNKPITVSKGERVEGKIIANLADDLVVDLGAKAEGVLSKKDLSAETLADLKVGQRVQLYVVSPETQSGQVSLSLFGPTGRRNQMNPKWNRFLDAAKTSQTLSGKGVEVNKGGLVVEVGGMRGFVPSSQVASSAAGNLEELIGKTLTLKVIEADPNQNRLVLAQKVILSDEAKQSLAALKPGQAVKGKVSAVMPFGAFLTLESGVDGFIHISELSWERQEDPSNVVTVGQELEAQVLSTDEETGKVNLSLKVMQRDPFAQLSEKYIQDDVIKAKVTGKTAAGLTVELEPGVEGVMPNEVLDPATDYPIGEMITVLIDKVDTERRKITVSPMLTSTSGLIYK